MGESCRCGHADEAHVTDIFGTVFRRPKTARQLGVPCLECDCDDWTAIESAGVPYTADLLSQEPDDDHDA